METVSTQTCLFPQVGCGESFSVLHGFVQQGYWCRVSWMRIFRTASQFLYRFLYSVFFFFFFLTPASNLKNFRAKNFHLNFDFSLFLLFPLKLKTPLNNG